MLKINDLIGKDVMFNVGGNPVLVNVEDMNNMGYTCTVKESESKWYTVGDTYYIPIGTFVLQVQK